MIEGRIFDLDAHIRRQSQGALEVVEGLLVVKFLLQQTGLCRDQRLAGLGHLQLLTGNRILSGRNNRQLLAKGVFEARQVITKPSNVFLRVSDLELVLDESQKAADLGDRSATAKASPASVVLNIANRTKSTPKTRKALQARSTEKAPASSRPRFGLPTHRDGRVKARAVSLKGTYVVQECSLGKCQPLHDHIATASPQKRLYKAKVDQRIGGLGVWTSQLPSQRVGKPDDQIPTSGKLTTQRQATRTARECAVGDRRARAPTRPPTQRPVSRVDRAIAGKELIAQQEPFGANVQCRQIKCFDF